MEDFLFFPVIRAPSNYDKSKWLLAPERNEMGINILYDKFRKNKIFRWILRSKGQGVKN